MSARTRLYEAKRAVIGLLVEELGDDDVQVSYSFPATPERILVYGGAVRVTRIQAVAEWAAATSETIVVDVWLQVTDPEGDVAAADTEIESLVGQILDAFTATPPLADGLTFVEIATAVAQRPILAPNPNPSTTSALQLGVTVRAVL